MNKVKQLITAVILVFGLVLSAYAGDVPGAKDYPLVSRFKGSEIKWFQNISFGPYYLLNLKDGQLNPSKIEGKIHRLQYEVNKAHSTYEVAQGYAVALKDAGFDVFLKLDQNNAPSNLNEHLYIAEFNGLNSLGSGSIKPDHNGVWNYLEAKGVSSGKDVHIVIYITSRDTTLITFDAIESAKLSRDLVTAKIIDKGIASSGHIVLDGILFDTGKSSIKHESNKALKNIAEYLNSHESMKFYIVGHTDNVGNFQSNMALSAARAKAVASTLVSGYGVSPSQIAPHGVANLSPVASNSDEAGRSQNRRVEIVEQ